MRFKAHTYLNVRKKWRVELQINVQIFVLCVVLHLRFSCKNRVFIEKTGTISRCSLYFMYFIPQQNKKRFDSKFRFTCGGEKKEECQVWSRLMWKMGKRWRLIEKRNQMVKWKCQTGRSWCRNGRERNWTRRCLWLYPW